MPAAAIAATPVAAGVPLVPVANTMAGAAPMEDVQ